jgi:DNA polymerase III epsilon subunit family exonuclease
MRLTRLDQKLMAGIVGFFLLPGLLGGGVLIALYRWGAFGDAFTLLVTVVVGLVTMMAYLGLIAHTVGQSLVRTVRQMQLGTELIGTVNPGHRLAIPTGDEFQLLAEEINRLADRLEAGGARGDTADAVPSSGGARARPLADDGAALDEMEQHTSPAERERALEDLSYTVLDTETTGFRAGRGDRIVSLACVRVRHGLVRPDECFDTLVNPGCPIPPGSTRIHGITDDMVAGASRIEEILPVLLRFARGTVLVGHEVWFDLRCLREATDSLLLPALTRSHPVLDTRSLSEVVHGSWGAHDLDTVAARLGVALNGRHSALGDAMATAEILARLLRLLRRRGIRSLGDSLEATRRLRRSPAGG